MTVTGKASVRETVALTVAGCGDDTTVVVKVSSTDGRVEYAKFPFAGGDAWTVDSGNLTASLTLNTVPLVAAFAPFGPADELDFIITVASRTNSNLYAKACLRLGNWMEDTDDPVAYSTPLADDVAALQSDLDALEAEFAAHDHDGTDSPTIPHASLSGVGANTHPAIDAALVDLNSANATNAANIVNLGNVTDDHEARLSAIEGAITPGDIPALPAVDDATFVDLYDALADAIAFINSLKGSQT